MSKSFRKQIPHLQQSKDGQDCGAACLEMLFNYYGNHKDREVIWNNIAALNERGYRDCRTYKMAQYASSFGYTAAAISCPTIETLVETCFENNIDVIIRYKRSKTADRHHFSVVVGSNYRGILLNDPYLDESHGCGKAIKEVDLRELMRSEPSSNVLSHIAVLIAKSDVPSITCTGYHHADTGLGPCSFRFFKCIADLHPIVICPVHDLAFASYSID